MRARSGASPGLSGRSSEPRPQGSPGAAEEAMLSRPGCEGHGDGSPKTGGARGAGKPGLLGAVRPGRAGGSQTRGAACPCRCCVDVQRCKHD